MAEPDFEQIARQIIADHLYNEDLSDAIADQLRQVWNARGAADIAKLDAELGGRMRQYDEAGYCITCGVQQGLPHKDGYECQSPSVKNLDRALRSLDR